MNLSDIIKQRISVRTFDPSRPVPQSDIADLRALASEVQTPFGGGFTIKISQFPVKGPMSPGTYGTISGASWFLLMGISDDETAPLAAGYAMERVVLRATELGLGTCWMALTFKGGDFARGAEFPAGQPLKIISPVGYPAQKRRLLEQITRAVARSASRKPIDQLFSQTRWGQPVAQDNPFFEALAMMRLAPSAKNAQPWRALVEADTVWFYYVKKSEASLLDLGIGLSHFDLTLRARGTQGTWQLAPAIEFPPAPAAYIPAARFTLP